MTEGGNIRQAAFKGLRQDKPAGEVKAEKPVMTKIAKPAAKPTAKSGKARPNPAGGKSTEVMGVVISKPDKEMWPDGGDGEGVTELALARSFEAGGGWVLGHWTGGRWWEAGVAAVFTPKDFRFSRIMREIVALVAERHAATVDIR